MSRCEIPEQSEAADQAVPQLDAARARDAFAGVGESVTEVGEVNQWMDRCEQLEREVQEQSQKLLAVRELLENSQQELQKFVYAVSHDLRAPLRAVSGFGAFLQEEYAESLDATGESYVRHMVQGAGRIAAIIDGLLEYSRVATLGVGFEPVDCRDVMEFVEASQADAIAVTGAKITKDELPEVMGDKEQIGQLFRHLIQNALKFHGDDPPSIHVGVTRHASEWEFSVTDNGIGMAPEHCGQVFDMFRRLNAREDYEGVGAGLAVSRRIIERHSGRIWAESEEGKGSTVRFTLPLVPPQEQV